MTSRDFTFWLQGLLEVGKPETLNKEQLDIVKAHLNLVFKHEIDPLLNEGKTEGQIKELQDIHDGKKEFKTVGKVVDSHKKANEEALKLGNHIKPKSFGNGWPGYSNDKTILRC